MQLVREIQVGVDVDGDGKPDLDASDHYSGQSFGGIYGTQFLALEPAVHAGRAERARRLDHRDRAASPSFRVAGRARC